MSKIDAVSHGNTNGAVKHEQDHSAPSHNAKLANLAKRWRSHEASDLALRHETGALLNDIHGEPTQRQRRGAYTMKNVEKQLGILVSELSRMRQFAHQFKSIDDLHKKHPLVKNWTQVRELLPKRSKSRKATAATNNESPTLRKARRALATLTDTFKSFGATPSSEERQGLLDSLQGFAAAVPDGLGFRLVIEDRPSDDLTTDQGQDVEVA